MRCLSEKKTHFIVRLSWWLIAGFSIFSAVYIVYREAPLSFQKGQLAKDLLSAEGMTFYQAGYYKQALPFFEKAYAQNVLREEDMIVMASLYLQEDKLQKG